MPELPELEVIKNNLLQQITGKTVRTATIIKPYVLKNYFTEDLHGESITDVQRRGKHILVFLRDHIMLMHLMLRGTLRLVLPSYDVKKSVAAVVRFTDGTVLELAERGHKKRVSLYIIRQHELDTHLDIGFEPLDPSFTQKTLHQLLNRKARRLKSFLRDQRTIAGIGNAYADEILWSARLSPFKMTTNIDNPETMRLHTAIRDVLMWAIHEVEKLGVSDKREFLRVHGKKDEPCPRCHTPILSVRASGSDTYYCANCQTRGRKLKDGRLSKFYR
jgi:formamidopyrimidine-DNA glycosylase